MRQHNFSLVGQGTPKKIYSKHAKSFIKHKLLESNRLKWMAGITSLIPENIIIPYPAEDLFWFLFKKLIEPNFLTVPVIFLYQRIATLIKLRKVKLIDFCYKLNFV